MRQLVAELGDVQVARSLPHSPFTAPVVASGGGGVRVAGELLHGGEVTHGVQQIAAEGLSKSVGGDLLYVGRMLGRAIVGMVNLLDLQMVVLGGKALGEAAYIYRREVEEALRKILYPERREVRVELSCAGEDSGAVGAASVVLHAAYSPRLMSLRSA